MFDKIRNIVQRNESVLFWFIFTFGIIGWIAAFWTIEVANAANNGITRIAQVEDSIIFEVRRRKTICYVIPQTPGTDTAFPVYAPAISCVRR